MHRLQDIVLEMILMNSNGRVVQTLPVNSFQSRQYHATRLPEGLPIQMLKYVAQSFTNSQAVLYDRYIARDSSEGCCEGPHTSHHYKVTTAYSGS